MSTPDFAEIRSSAIKSMPNIAIARVRYVVGALALGGSLFVLGNADPASAHVVKTSTKASSTKAATPKANLRLNTPAAGKAYTVTSGDNLATISKKTGVSASTIAQLNRVTNEDEIKPGQLLMIPSGSVVKQKAATKSATTKSTTPKPAAATSATTKPASTKASTAAVVPVPKAAVASTTTKKAASATTTTKSAVKKGTTNAGKPSAGQPLPDAIRGTNRAKLNPTFDRVAAQFGVPAELLKAIAYHESGWNNTKTSYVGAQGIGQIMPATADFVNKSLVKKKLDPAVPEDNIKMSAAFLRYLLNETGGDETKAVGAYYQGLGALQKHGLYQDTLVYISHVQALRAHWF